MIDLLSRLGLWLLEFMLSKSMVRMTELNGVDVIKLLHPSFGPNFREPMGTHGNPEVDMFLVGGNSNIFF